MEAAARRVRALRIVAQRRSLSVCATSSGGRSSPALAARAARTQVGGTLRARVRNGGKARDGGARRDACGYACECTSSARAGGGALALQLQRSHAR